MAYQGVWRKYVYAIAAVLVGVFCSVICLGAYVYLQPLNPQMHIRSKVVLDRNGQLLRSFTTPDGRWRLPVTHQDVDLRYIEFLKAYEDRRFDTHSGVDSLALMRAVGQMLSQARIVSGGSTLTMQVARLSDPPQQRSIWLKFQQIVRALAIEQQHSKSEVLSHYLALAPFGGNLEGVRAASLAYFGKEPRRLSIGEAALLVAIPQSPQARRPDRASESILRVTRNRVIERAFAQGLIKREDADRALEEPVPLKRYAFPLHAPFVAQEQLRAHIKDTTNNDNVIKLTINKAIQVQLEALVKERSLALLPSFPPSLSIAIVVIEHETGTLQASIGGVRFLDASRAGAVDLTRTVRSPGSALKPFIYAMAFEQGLAHPETQLEDRPSRYGIYAPENFDQAFQGLVSARYALQQSLNVPAVELLSSLGPQLFLSRLKTAGVQIVLPVEREGVGLAVGLGGLSISLHDLTRLYAGLAQKGIMKPLRVRESDKTPFEQVRRLTDPVSAWYVSDILRGAPPPPHSAFGRIAFKTGTSYGYRDAWAVGYDRKHVIGVWVGRPDGAPVAGLVGRLVAAPILFDAFNRIGLDPEPFIKPQGALVAVNQTLPSPLKHIRQDVAKTAKLTHAALKIAFPLTGSRLEVKQKNEEVQQLSEVLLKINGGTPPFMWLMNGRPVLSGEMNRTLSWKPDGLGFIDMSVIDATGASDRVQVRLE